MNKWFKGEILSLEEETDLVSRAQAGETLARDRLVGSHMRLVVSHVRRYRMRDQSLDDLVMEGALGLMKAIDRFDPHRGFRFGTYARWWVKEAITDYLLKNCNPICVGSTRKQKRLFFNLSKACRGLGLNPEGVLTYEEKALVAEKLAVTVQDINIFKMSRASTVSLERLPDGSGGEAASETIEDELCSNSDDDYRKKLLKEAMTYLSPREMIIMQRRVLAETPVFLNVVAKELGISKERVRQIEGHVMRRLKALVEGLQASMPYHPGHAHAVADGAPEPRHEAR